LWHTASHASRKTVVTGNPETVIESSTETVVKAGVKPHIIKRKYLKPNPNLLNSNPKPDLKPNLVKIHIKTHAVVTSLWTRPVPSLQTKHGLAGEALASQSLAMRQPAIRHLLADVLGLPGPGFWLAPGVW
jgi:hypothetical protein